MNAPEKIKQYDRDAQSVGNIVHLEHFNVVIPDQRLATLFYVTGLGGTRDPYLFTGLENMWVNFGRTQVHLPSRAVPPRAETNSTFGTRVRLECSSRNRITFFTAGYM